MIAMYEKYGYYKDAVKAIGLSGIEGLAKIQSIMETLRNNTPTEVGGYKVTSARDYKLDTIKDMATGEVKPTGLPSSNVLYYDLEDGAWICVCLLYTSKVHQATVIQVPLLMTRK